MSAYSGHLNDDHLFECYVARHTGAAIDPRAADHLSDCDACMTRYDEFAAFMDGLREHAEVETDEQFPTERLIAQQQQILRRLVQVHRSARVITFPGQDAGGATRSPRLSARWLAAAAAAGLFIGVAVGGYLAPDHLHRLPRVRQTQVAPAMRVQPTPAVLVSSPQVEVPDDDAFLIELELALAGPRTRELQPFDALTPHVQDIDNRTR